MDAVLAWILFCLWELLYRVCRQLPDKITAEVYFRLLTFKQLLSPVHSTASGSNPTFPFVTVSSSERDSAVQEKRESRDYVALEALVVLK